MSALATVFLGSASSFVLLRREPLRCVTIIQAYTGFASFGDSFRAIEFAAGMVLFSGAVAILLVRSPNSRRDRP